MIKINLAQNIGGGSSMSEAGLQGGVSSEESALIRKTALTRLAVLLLGPIALLLYEQQTLPVLQVQLQRANKELSDLADKNARAADAVIQTKKFKKEQEILQTQINSIENLKKDRLREVKLLDFIQKDIPEKLWLTRLEMTEGKLVIQGLATTDNDLTQFMDTLSKSAYLKEVSLVRSSEQGNNSGPAPTAPDATALKKFEISCLMETLP